MYEKFSFHKISSMHSLWAEDLILLLVQQSGIRLPPQNSTYASYRYPKPASRT